MTHWLIDCLAKAIAIAAKQTAELYSKWQHGVRIEVTTDITDVGFSETNLSLVYCHGQALLTSQYRISCYVELDKLRL